MDVAVAEDELAEAEALDRYVSNLLAGRHAALPAGVDSGGLRAYLIATTLIAERCQADSASQATATENRVSRGMPRQ
jgi:hypothetical protein